MRKICIIEEDDKERDTLTALLEDEYRITAVPEETALESAPRKKSWDLIVLGLSGNVQRKGIQALQRLRDMAPSTPVLCRLPHGDPGVHTTLLRLGVSACISRCCPKEELKAWLREVRAVPVSRFSVSEAARPFRPPQAPQGLLGDSKAIQYVRSQIELVARYDFPVLLTGECGTGKELAARSIHRLSPRASFPFLAVNCGALPEMIVESELFGTEKGAYTDAVSRPGHFEMANHGILFLDEVTELAPNAQAKLLRALEDGEVRRLGGGRTLHCDVRLISATNADLDTRTAFRYDLLERLETLLLELPPLREHPEDIPILCRHFLDRSNLGALLCESALDKLRGYDWPGNVRQLRNTILRAAVLAEGASSGSIPEIRPEHIRFGRRPARG